jgi:hypothetical protein
LDLASRGVGRAVSSFRYLNLSGNSVLRGDAALSIDWNNDLSVAHVIVEYNEGDILLFLDGSRLRSIQCITCVRNTDRVDGEDYSHGILYTDQSVRLAECVFVGNTYRTFVASWGDITLTLIGCVLPPGTLIGTQDWVQVETANCTVQKDGEAMIDSGFCPTIIPRTSRPTAFFTPPLNYKYLRFDVIRFGLFLFAM